MENREKLVLIDGNSLINRAFYALPLLTNSNGEYSNAVYGFCNIIIKLLEQEHPKYMAVAFDFGKPTFRHKIYAEYKAGRKKMPEELAVQLPILKSVLRAMNISFVEKEGIEADDIIGTLSRKFDTENIIVSGDKDLFQIVDDHTTVWFTKRGITDTIKVTPQNIGEIYGVNANQVVELKALMGDSSDNIKGVAGIGEKTAKSLLSQFYNIDGIYQNLDSVKGKVLQNLQSGKEDAYLSRMLATIDTSADISISLDQLEYDFPFGENALNLFKHYEFNSIIKKTEIFAGVQKQQPKKIVNINNIQTYEGLKTLIESLLQTENFAIYVGNNNIHIANSKFEENIINLQADFGNANVWELLKAMLENSSIKKITLNSKNLKTLALKNNVKISGVQFDCNLAKYLLSGSKKTDVQAQDLCNEFDYDDNCVATCLLVAHDNLMLDLQNTNMQNLYFDIELPLVDVLVDMEQNGFKIDKTNLIKLGETYKKQQEDLTAEIYADAGCQFNIKSPKQVADVLFDKLNLKRPRGLKKSVDANVLEKISEQHPVINKILKYRKIEKLLGGYIEPFEKMIDEKTGLIHTIFNQTLTSTGRLSSSEPNLQNIPIKDEEGKNLRKVFVPRQEDGCLITSDYSQIELRLLAHYSQDPKLIEAYNKHLDIHSQTASNIFGLPESFITNDLRRKAKTVNFGIIYGMSEYGLSKSLKISVSEAKQIIESYFDNYSHVKNFMNSIVESARQNGYVSTLCGRRRVIDDINSKNYNTRQFAERASMNMPLQGTASDIIKIAMVKVYKELKQKNLKSKLILQIHDELIIDCVKGEEQIVKNILKECMENAVNLSVPLEVEVEAGKTWFDAK